MQFIHCSFYLFFWASTDGIRSSRERNTFPSHTVTSLPAIFVSNLILMYYKLASRSLLLQSNSATIIEEHNRVLLSKQAIKPFESKSVFQENQILSKIFGIKPCQNIKRLVMIPRTRLFRHHWYHQCLNFLQHFIWERFIWRAHWTWESAISFWIDKEQHKKPSVCWCQLKTQRLNIKIGLGKEAWMKEYVSDSLENTWDQEKNKTRKLSNSRQL